jgi:hypothetical protein
MMSRLRWTAISIVELLGWQGVAGITVLAACAIYYVVAVHPLKERMALLGVAVASDQRKGAGASVAGPQSDLAQFKKSFETERTVEDQLSALHDAAKATGLVLKRIEYRMLEDRRAALRQYQIVMPTAGKYPQVRQFVSLALAKVPALSLDQISFQRRRIGDATVEAELRFTLFLADPP